MTPASSMHMMQSVEDCTTLLSKASRRRMPTAKDTARQVCISSQRNVTATNNSTTTSVGAAASSRRRCETNAYIDSAAMPPHNSSSTARLRRQLDANSAAASSAHSASNKMEVQDAGRRGAPSFTVSVASAWTTMPGSEPYTGTASMSPSSSAVAPMKTDLPANTSSGTRPSSTSAYDT